MPGISAESAYLFRHALLRDAAYELQLPETRRQLHHLAGEILEALITGGPPPLPDDWVDRLRVQPGDEFANELAEHAELAGEGEDERALRWLWRAGVHADANWQIELGVKHWRRIANHPAASTRHSLQALVRCGAQVHELGRVDEAEQLLRDALKRSEAAGDILGRGHAMAKLGSVMETRGQMEEAEAVYEKALELARECGNRRLEGSIIGTLGALHFYLLGDSSAAEEMDKAGDIAREIGDRYREGAWMGHVAVVQSVSGNFELAREGLESALRIAREIRDRRLEGAWLGHLATNEERAGNYEVAEELYGRAIEVTRAIGDVRTLIQQYGNRANLFQVTGRYAEARRGYEDALRMSEELGNPYLIGLWLSNIGSLLRELDRAEEATKSLKRALEFARRSGDTEGEAFCLTSLAAAAVERGDLAEGARLWQRVREQLVDRNLTRILEDSRESLNKALRAQGHPPLTEDGDFPH